jgi:hypothetical protein
MNKGLVKSEVEREATPSKHDDLQIPKVHTGLEMISHEAR